MKKYVAEAIGTFGLVFCGTGAVVINQHTNGAVSHVGIAITFGLIVMAMIFAFGKLSGAHINPAVSIAFAFTDIFPKRELIPYIISQLAGALLASLALRLMFPESIGLGETIPAGKCYANLYSRGHFNLFLNAGYPIGQSKRRFSKPVYGNSSRWSSFAGSYVCRTCFGCFYEPCPFSGTSIGLWQFIKRMGVYGSAHYWCSACLF